MPRLRVWLIVAGFLSTTGRGSAQSPSAKESAQAVRALADTIDRHIASRWKSAGVTPAPAADDAEFLRRVSLDLAGRIPSVAEARQFLADRHPDRRQRLVDRLLASPRYAAHFGRVFRSLWLPEAGSNLATALLVPGFEGWVSKQLAANRGYDELVRDLLTVRITAEKDAMMQVQRVFSLSRSGETTPVAFYMAKENRPENLAAGTARLFLGVSIECAQCHHHPCGSWKREDFWSFAAFFAGIESKQFADGGYNFPVGEALDRRALRIPGTEKVVQATFLDRSRPKWQPDSKPRSVLAGWVTSADNPYFARAAVNRVWAYFFGTGLVDPVDDMFEAHNPASHPELLDELARAFAARRFDLKFLMRAITISRTYQLSSAGAAGKQEPRLFARMALRGLTAEQLYESVAIATGYRESGKAGSPLAAFQAAPSLRAEFLGRFATASEKPTAFQTSILHALTLMNGKLLADATSLERSETLGAVVDAPFMDTRGRIEALYLAALSRRPRPVELARMTRHVEGAADGNRALADVFWVLLNSGEFLLNH